MLSSNAHLRQARCTHVDHNLVRILLVISNNVGRKLCTFRVYHSRSSAGSASGYDLCAVIGQSKCILPVYPRYTLLEGLFQHSLLETGWRVHYIMADSLLQSRVFYAEAGLSQD